MVLRRCRSLLRNEDQAMDAMHDTFVELLKARARLEPEAPSSLLFRMATNICLNRIRAAGRRPEDANTELIDRLASIEEPETLLSAQNLLDRLFAREKPSTRTIAVLHLLDGLTLEEVAREVGLSVSGVRKRLSSLRANLENLEGVSK